MAMAGEELVARARAEAEAFADEALTPAAIETLRAECAALFDALPEPPPYRRAEDPIRKRATDLLPQASVLLTRLTAAARATPADARLLALERATELHVRALAAIANAEIVAAEDLAQQAWQAARAVTGAAALLSSDRGAGPLPAVYDRSRGVSRYDPRPEPTLTLQLVCPNEGCRQTAAYAVAPRHAVHRFSCQHCRRSFTGHFVELQRGESRPTGKSTHYTLRGTALGGGQATLDFDDASGHELAAVARDLLVLLYPGSGSLAAVENVSTGTVLWIVPRAACFIATAAYGVDAPELETFREFRDRALMPRAWGRLFVRAYYAVGPTLARPVAKHPALRRAVKAALEPIRAMIRSP